MMFVDNATEDESALPEVPSTLTVDDARRLVMSDGDVRRVRTAVGGKLLFNPYNPANIPIQPADVVALLETYGVPGEIRNMALFRRAFVHRSYVRRPYFEYSAMQITLADCPPNCLPLCTRSNERLEFIGDGILECITKLYLYQRFPKEEESFMTIKKIAIVKNEHLGQLAWKMGLHKWLILSRHAEEDNTRTTVKKLGCLFEAFLGALFLNFSQPRPTLDTSVMLSPHAAELPAFCMAQQFLVNVFETHIDWTTLINTDDNYKHMLQVRIQKALKTMPHYMKLGFDQERMMFHMGVFLWVGGPVGNSTPPPPPHDLVAADALPITQFRSFAHLQQHQAAHGYVFVFLGEGRHCVKRTAEQQACKLALQRIQGFECAPIVGAANP